MMCGISGVFGENVENIETLTRTVCKAISHRGPDASRIAISQNQQLGLGMNTLKIVSPDTAGGPYVDSVTGSMITFNGEIYNFRELATQMDISLRLDQTDAELVLYGYLKVGFEILEKLDGMFAFAIIPP